MNKASLNILFTCTGRRVELLRAFRRAAESLRVRLEIHGADVSPLSPALHLTDKAHLVPRIGNPGYVDALIEIAHRSGIDLLIPLLDPELPLIAAARERFARIGCRALISSESVVQTCCDKLATYKTLREAGVDTPATWTLAKVIERKRHRFPYFMKPRMGSAGEGNHIIHNVQELRTFGERVEEPIVQEFVEGEEHTLDVYCDFTERPRCVVPRRRLEVRTGEVSKGLIVKDRVIMAVGKRVAEVLGACRGVITVQVIATCKGGRDGCRAVRVIEINPRFGGGVPLSIHAGADFPKWILMELLGKKPRIRVDGFRNDVVMLRYDDAVYLDHASAPLPSGCKQTR